MPAPNRSDPAKVSFGDVVLALAMAAITVPASVGEAVAHVDALGQTVTHGGHAAVHNVNGAAFVLVGVAALALVWRRRRPVPVWLVSLGCVALFSALGYVNGAALLDVMVALYTVAVMGGTRLGLVAGAATVMLLMGFTTSPFSPFGPTGGGFFLIPAEAAAAVSLGLAVGNRRDYTRAVEERAAQAERTREEEARRRVDAERLRIARELHDVVAHTMSMIHVQASAAAQLLRSDPDQAAESIQAIRTASREGLGELRSILSVLRQSDESESRLPAPGLAQIGELVASTARAGLPTTLQVNGTPRHAPPTVELAAYRIVQESLTNALRHAGPCTATVSLEWHDGVLDLRVADSGRGGSVSGPNAGHGIAGMRERAAAVGGELHAGAGDDGGFVVSARLPVETVP